jgi:hypothetical protein
MVETGTACSSDWVMLSFRWWDETQMTRGSIRTPAFFKLQIAWLIGLVLLVLGRVLMARAGGAQEASPAL